MTDRLIHPMEMLGAPGAGIAIAAKGQGGLAGGHPAAHPRGPVAGATLAAVRARRGGSMGIVRVKDGDVARGGSAVIEAGPPCA
ncbi:hypothetical protein AB0C14_31275 [Microbispora hainanensis]|uniref:hypothetical protein n=1 Tax=Microbispora hainanensis TaxID=568844 RepID=UPI0033D521AE